LMELIFSSETSVLKRATQRHIPEDGILHSHNSYVTSINRTRINRITILTFV
jgi:hypothetical protein